MDSVHKKEINRSCTQTKEATNPSTDTAQLTKRSTLSRYLEIVRSLHPDRRKSSERDLERFYEAKRTQRDCLVEEGAGRSWVGHQRR